MEISEETAEALRDEFRLIKRALRDAPEMPISLVFACACTGPLPECRCRKRRRLVEEFLASD